MNKSELECFKSRHDDDDDDDDEVGRFQKLQITVSRLAKKVVKNSFLPED